MSLKARVSRILRKKSETKFVEAAEENIQLYHNVGKSVAYIGASNPYAIIFNPWASISQGTSRYQRVGDRIYPVGMRLNLWLANKNDRPNVTYRVIVGYYKSKINPDTGNKWSGVNEKICGSGSNNLNNLIDPERFRAIKDKLYHLENGVAENAAGAGKETHRRINMWISRKKKTEVIYDANANIINSPLAVFVIPYDSYGTLVTDNISSCAYASRLYFKDP